MLADADRNAFAVQNSADIVRVNTLQHKRDHTRLAFGLADDPQRIDAFQPAGRIGQQVMLMGGNRPDPDALDILDGRP